MAAGQPQSPEVNRDQYNDFISNPLWARIKEALKVQQQQAIRGLRECPDGEIAIHRATLSVIDTILETPKDVLEEINEEESDA